MVKYLKIEDLKIIKFEKYEVNESYIIKENKKILNEKICRIFVIFMYQNEEIPGYVEKVEYYKNGKKTDIEGYDVVLFSNKYRVNDLEEVNVVENAFYEFKERVR